MRVSEKVTINEIESWKQGDIVTIKAGTGAGKSYFIKNNLYAIAKRDNKRILMLIHRKNCTDQFLMEIKAADKEDIIDIRTYQSIEAVEKSGIIYELGHYDYIVADEFHYFMSDAAFNMYTDLSLDVILGHSRAVRIFMSATGDYMKHYLSDMKHKGLTTIDYELPIDFSFIRRLEFFYKDETLETYIEHFIENNKKAIFFIQSPAKAYQLHKKYKEYTLFNCGKSNRGNYYQYVDKQKINDMLKNEHFEELILITTSVLDAGVNLVDSELNEIVCDIEDTGTLIQCIGRKRLQNKGDYINLHVKALSNQRLGGMETQARNKLDLALYFLEHGQKKLVRKEYRKLNDNLIYDEIIESGTEKRLNKLMFFKIVTDIAEIEKIKDKELGKEAYCMYISEEILSKTTYKIFEEEEHKDSLEIYLNTLVGTVMLQVPDREELIKMLNVRDGRNNRLLKGIDTLNGMLKENKYNYIIDQFQTSRMVEGKKKNYKSAWRVRRLSDK